MAATGWKRFIGSPWPYAAWAVFVIAALSVTYFIEPYTFGFSAMILLGLCSLVAVLSLVGAWQRRGEGSYWPIAAMFSCVLIAFIAVAVAFAVLRTFHWA